MPSSTLTSKGQITLPKEVREHLHVKEGDRVDFVIDEAGHVVLQPARSRLGELWGMVHEPGRKALTVEEMDEAIERRRGRR
jgi:AbrB family looped-hinge helix DNA binding protein